MKTTEKLLDTASDKKNSGTKRSKEQKRGKVKQQQRNIFYSDCFYIELYRKNHLLSKNILFRKPTAAATGGAL